MTTVTRSVLLALAAFELILGMKPAWGKAGSLDPTFGQNGVTVTNFAKLALSSLTPSNCNPMARSWYWSQLAGEKRGF